MDLPVQTFIVPTILTWLIGPWPFDLRFDPICQVESEQNVNPSLLNA